MYEIYRNGEPTGYKGHELIEVEYDLEGLKIHPDNKEWIKADFEIKWVENEKRKE